ncbi:MAG: homoserine dehydrogenase, partial [Aurantimonas coralicida]|nr:homoserine dehydrogenase [Aurantimonas coralicida]
KRDLTPGETLGRIGEADYRGYAMTWEDGRTRRALPIGLVEKARVLQPIRAGELLTHDNCAPDESLLVTRMRAELDAADGRFAA